MGSGGRGQVVSGGVRWGQVVEVRWCQVVSGGVRWCQVVSGGRALTGKIRGPRFNPRWTGFFSF